MNRRHIKIAYLLTAPEPARGKTAKDEEVNGQGGKRRGKGALAPRGADVLVHIMTNDVSCQ